MNRLRVLVSAFVSLAFLVIPSALLSYDGSPSNEVVLPECIWAPATGGGTWVTQLQITAVTAGVVVNVYFWHSGGVRYVSNLWTSPGINACVKFPNILSTLQSRDPSFNYYGKVGALVFQNVDTSMLYQVQARIVNGNYGKTLPGFALNGLGNTANVGRNMMIQDLTQNATYRTFVGVFNSSAGIMTVQFFIYSANGTALGSFTKTFGSNEFMSFNPFIEAGVGSGTYDNCWLYIAVTFNLYPGRGLFCFGSSANNYTNDTSAHLGVQHQ